MRCGRYYLRLIWISLLVWIVCVIGCPTPSAATNPHELKDVWVIHQGGQWHVVLIGPESMTYKATKASDPPRVVVDLPNTVSKPTITSPIRENEVIGRVKTSTVVHDPQPLTRVEIGLNLDASYEISRKQEKIWISFNIVPPITRAEPSHIEPAAEAKSDVSPTDTKESEVAVTPQPSTEEPLPVVIEVLPPASKVIAIEPVAMKEHSDVHIVGDGSFDEYDFFLLRDPPRLVVDLLGVNSTEVKDELILSVPWAKRIRVGQHPEKVRVVFDLSFTPKGELPFQVILEENRLMVSLTNDG